MFKNVQRKGKKSKMYTFVIVYSLPLIISRDNREARGALHFKLSENFE